MAIKKSTGAHAVTKSPSVSPTMATSPPQAVEPPKAPMHYLKRTQYDWGDICTGAKDALISAGLGAEGQFPGDPGRLRGTHHYDSNREPCAARGAALTIQRWGKKFHLTVYLTEEQQDLRKAAADAGHAPFTGAGSLTLGAPISEEPGAPGERRSPIADAAVAIADAMRGADAMTREHVGPLLAKLASAPEDVSQITRMVEALVGVAERASTDAEATKLIVQRELASGETTRRVMHSARIYTFPVAPHIASSTPFPLFEGPLR